MMRQNMRKRRTAGVTLLWFGFLLGLLLNCQQLLVDLRRDVWLYAVTLVAI